MTTGHRHRIVRIVRLRRRGGLRWWLLQRTLWTTRDRTWAIESPYPVQECPTPTTMCRSTGSPSSDSCTAGPASPSPSPTPRTKRLA